MLGPALVNQTDADVGPGGNVSASTESGQGESQDPPILVDDGDQDSPVNVASTCHSFDRRDGREVMGNKLSTIQQESKRSKANTTASGRTLEERRLATAPKKDFNETASTKSREASKEDCTIASSQSRRDIDFVCRLPKQQRNQYAPLKSRDALPCIEGVAYTSGIFSNTKPEVGLLESSVITVIARQHS